MGACSSKKSLNKVDNEGDDPPENSVTGPRKFREERSEFERTGKVDYNEDELVFDLRTMLDDPMGQKALAAAANKYLNKENLFCWVDIHEYHSIPTNDFRRGTAVRIWNKYIKESAPMLVGGIPQEEIEHVRSEVTEARTNRKLLGKDLFDAIGAICFKELFNGTYLPFRRTPDYRAYKSSYARTYVVRASENEARETGRTKKRGVEAKSIVTLRRRRLPSGGVEERRLLMCSSYYC